MLYFIYVFSFGSFFLIRYLITERKIKSKKELALLLLFPMAGYGNWLYNRELREFKNPNLPRKWYIWRKMVYQNFLLILLSSVWMGVLLLLSIFYNLGDSLQISEGTFSLLEDNIDPTMGIGLFLAAIMGFLLILFLLFILVLIPAIIAKVIRLKYEKKH